MLRRIKKTILRLKMIEPGDIVIAAVSGGPDSVCLLDVLDRLRDEMSFRLEVAHFEHGIRGENSRRDAEFVKEIAESRGLKLTIETGNVPKTAKTKKMSIEEAAREARYTFFERLLSERRGTACRAPTDDEKVKIALGHTATDQAETVLMRLLRGSGPRGLAGIPPMRGPYIRPLIEVERKDVIAYLKKRRLKWMEDETNILPAHLRNRLRRELIPMLEREFNPRLIEALCRTAEACRAVEDYLESEGAKIIQAYALKKEKGVFLPQKAFVETHSSIATIAFELLWKMARGNLAKLRSEHRTKIVNAAREGRSGIFYLPDGWIALVDSSGILISPELPIEPVEYCMPLKIPGETVIAATGAKILAEFISRGSGEPWMGADSSEAYLDFEAMKPPIEVRAPRPGDRMKPIGGAGTRKLQDIFTDMKIPRWARPRIPVIAAGGEIAWVAPLKISHRFRITDKSIKLLHLRLLSPFSFE